MRCFAQFGPICAILKNVKKTHGGMVLLVNLQALASSPLISEAKFGDDPLAQHSIIISTILLLKFVSVHFVSGKDISISYTWRYPSSILRTVKTCRFDKLALN